MRNLLKSALLITALSLAFTTANAQTGKIIFENTSYDFGSNISEKSENITHRFVFTNQGDVPVTIQDVSSSCDCTTLAWTKEPVASGEQGFVDVIYNPANRSGNFTENIEVKSDGDPQTISLTISGAVVNEPEHEETPDNAEN
ncbi:MAG: DUF1573 domain-containing protein [Prevotellaceae bacterium]|jgi:hypothetical protein|nr:DUF1573 domain-containing protein [Prevotellaceae bacterium]